MREHPFLTLCPIALLAALCLSGCRQQGAADTTPPAAPPPRIMLGPRKTFDIEGLSAPELSEIQRLDTPQRNSVLQVFVDPRERETPALLGEVSIDNKILRFTPRFPLDAGMRYRAVFDLGKLAGGSGAQASLSVTFEIPENAMQPPTTVEHVYPSGDRLPENQLKFYLHFSAPMSRGEAYRHVHLVDAAGKENEAVFLELGEELWDPSMRRFTLFFDPGRVKRGLKPREELGPVLEEGGDYTLVIDRDWLDATGQPLAATIKKTFHVLPPDDVPVDPALWKITPPMAGSSEVLTVRFPEPLDHSMLQRVVSVRTADGNEVTGTIEVSEGETCWQFRPAQPWIVGVYQLLAATTLEDLAGNSIGRAFDVDVFGPVQRKITTDTVSVPFSVGSEAE